ncbi:unconventional myosin-VIIa isoform X2 [Nematostella vectensis]|uniref:unconventional myosin-VIIa isoform X2 n=1 Tax=Nematostella vectensis TaxID=45351 RepID=UPI002076F720|nr:unconventional myosin-VIIa isoform X2 [Nematostella vectensis]
MELETIRNHTEPHDLSLYKFMTYARKNFQGEAPCWFKKGSLREPLLHHEDKMEAEAALTIYVAIQRFMIDLPEPKVEELEDSPKDDMIFASLPPLSIMAKPTTNLRKVRFICGYGHNVPNLRDEIYCQLCKQLVNNPSMTSTRRGWILMGILCGVFPPSDQFLNYLKNFILTEATEHVAEFCISRLRRTVERTNRKQPPSWIEMQASRRAENIVLPVTLMDGATLDCEVDANSTFKELCESIREKLGLKSIYGFSIYIAAVDQIFNWGSDDENVMDAVSLAERYSVRKGNPESDTKLHFYLRKNIFRPSYNPEDDPLEANLVFAQLMGGLHKGEYRCQEVNDLADIIAKRYYIEHGAELDLNRLQEVILKTAPQDELKGDPEMMEDLMEEIKSSFDSIPCIRNALSSDQVKASLVRESMMRWALSFSKSYTGVLVSGPKLDPARINLDINSTGAIIQAIPSAQVKAYRASIEFAQLEEIADYNPYDKKPKITNPKDTVVLITMQKKVYHMRSKAAREIRDLMKLLLNDYKQRGVAENNN